MAALKSIGKLLEDSEWNSAVVDAGMASSRIASNVTKTRLAHQITACTLYKLMTEAYKDYCSEDRSTLTFEEWRDQRMLESPQFQFWHLVLDLELIIFTVIRSFREGNFTLYREALSGLIPYFFANNNVNYACWLPVHLNDMMSLER